MIPHPSSMLIPRHLERDPLKQSPVARMREKFNLDLIQFRVVVYDCSHLVDRMSDNLFRNSDVSPPTSPSTVTQRGVKEECCNSQIGPYLAFLSLSVSRRTWSGDLVRYEGGSESNTLNVKKCHGLGLPCTSDPDVGSKVVVSLST